MEDLLASLEASSLPQALRFSRWAYAAVNTAHIACIAVLFGSVVALDLRLMGFWRSIDRGPFVTALSTIAATGLCAAIFTGAFLSSTRATEYAVLPVFRVKIGLILIGVLHAVWLHHKFGRALERADAQHARTAGIISLLIWLAALICGRMIAFSG